MRTLLLVLAFAAVDRPAAAVEWSALFASDTATVAFLAADGGLWRAPFNLARAETLWSARDGQRVVRVAAEPEGRGLAWITRAGEQDTSRLWLASSSGVRRRALYFALRPNDFHQVRFSAARPTVRDRGFRGARFLEPDLPMLLPSSNSLTWLPGGGAVAFGFDGGLAIAPLDSGAIRQTSVALAMDLQRLEPAPLLLADVLVLRQQLHFVGPLGFDTPRTGVTPRSGAQPVLIDGREGEEAQLPSLLKEREGRTIVREGKPVEAWYLVYPLPGGWRTFPASGLDFTRPWTASASTVWWAQGRTLHAIDVHDPVPRVELEEKAPIAWLDYDERLGALDWAAGRAFRRLRVGARPEVVASSAQRIRAVLADPRRDVVGLVAGDSLLIVSRSSGEVRRVALPGPRPAHLFQAGDGSVLVVSRAVNGRVESIARLAPGAERLEVSRAPKMDGDGVVPAPGGGHLIFHALGSHPPAMLHVYDVASGAWHEVRNPHVVGWEALSSR